MSDKVISTFLGFSYLLFLIAFAGCGGLKTTSSFSPPERDLNSYYALQIESFVTDIPDFPEDALSEIPSDVAERLSSNNTFKRVKYGQIEDVPARDTLVLLGEITEFRTASDITFEGGALKFGEVAVTIKLAIVQKNTGDEITTGEVSGFSSMGFAATDKYKELSEEIVNFLSDSY